MDGILVHACCADCSLKLIDALPAGYSREAVTLYFYNPNIHPEQEWLARQQALKAVAAANNLKLVIANWQPAQYFDRIKNIDPGHKQSRCPLCYSVRLEQTAIYAAAHGFTAFTTTMLTSEYLDNQAVRTIGRHQAALYGLIFVAPDHINSCLHTAGFYKQNYCGCVYSLKERMEEKFL